MGDEVSFFSGLTYSPDEVASEGVLVIRSSNVKDGSLVNADNIYVSSETANVTRVKSGDIVVVVRNGSKRLIGKHAIFKTSIQSVIGAFMTGIRTEQFDFFNAVLDGVQFRDEINKNLGATINQITTGNFKAMHFTIPINSSERDRIGKIFRSVDDTIALHQRSWLKPTVKKNRDTLTKMVFVCVYK